MKKVIMALLISVLTLMTVLAYAGITVVNQTQNAVQLKICFDKGNLCSTSLPIMPKKSLEVAWNQFLDAIPSKNPVLLSAVNKNSNQAMATAIVHVNQSKISGRVIDISRSAKNQYHFSGCSSENTADSFENCALNIRP